MDDRENTTKDADELRARLDAKWRAACPDIEEVEIDLLERVLGRLPNLQERTLDREAILAVYRAGKQSQVMKRARICGACSGVQWIPDWTGDWKECRNCGQVYVLPLRGR